MQTPKKDWTQQERDRFERVFCAFISSDKFGSTHILDHIKYAETAIQALDEHYKTTSNEQSTNN
jgi:hypothetical protein